MSLGLQGEEVAANYLQNKGYQVLERNFRCKMGEIDIIACIDRTLVFVEVKTRRSLNYGLPCEAVTKTKKLHIRKVAAFYVMKNKIGNINRRIDVVEILYQGEKAYIRHTENAF
ncbi:YraN family protein [Aminipila luticellarii]|uniref:UPF0102 protein EQM06_08235 n=1 Tax=Aminipila luticellarii TaxID=2507160 RepID=A0A410PW96_9FIRM|nr:YraN family protein [Aminipila luticellarii]QAT43208.1 YraN family protein [Aminipila luticellarii]